MIQILKQLLNSEVIVTIIIFLIGIIASLIFNKKGKQNTILVQKIVDDLLALAEQTGLVGEDKKKWLIDMFSKFGLKDDFNLDEYIDDKIELANNINIKKSDIEKIIGPELVPKELMEETHARLKTLYLKYYNLYNDKDLEYQQLKEEFDNYIEDVKVNKVETIDEIKVIELENKIKQINDSNNQLKMSVETYETKMKSKEITIELLNKKINDYQTEVERLSNIINGKDE